MSRTEPDVICEAITQTLPLVKQGSLRIWGRFFGRPYDNVHRIVGCEPLADGVQLKFQDSETLTIWQPSRWVVGSERFEIAEASRVRWEWFYYGREKLPRNLFYIDYAASGDDAEVSTNVDWYPEPAIIRRDGPAVELL